MNQNSQKTPDQLTTSSDEDIAIEEDVNICEKCGKITKESDQNVHCTCISISQGSTLNNKERKLQQMRANVIREIVSSERVFVRHLKDVVEVRHNTVTNVLQTCDYYCKFRIFRVT